MGRGNRRDRGKKGGTQKEYKRGLARPGSGAHNHLIGAAGHCVAVATITVPGQEVKEFTGYSSPYTSMHSPTKKSHSPRNGDS